MTRRMRTAVVAGALSLAVLTPSAAAMAQDNRPPRDPSPPSYDGRYHHRDHDGCNHDGYERRGNYRHGYNDEHGQWHDGQHDGPGRHHRW